jgi:RNA polymerase sigma-70 factor (ECF subfamily)
VETSKNSSERDVLLMQRLCAGDEAAFDELVERHQKNVLNLAYRYTGDRTLAEDMAQEIFLKVYRARDRWTPAARFSTWLYRIAVNHCLNELRARRARPAVAMPASESAEEPLSETPGDSVRRQEIRLNKWRYDAFIFRAGPVESLIAAGDGTLFKVQMITTVAREVRRVTYRVAIIRLR